MGNKKKKTPKNRGWRLSRSCSYKNQSRRAQRGSGKKPEDGRAAMLGVPEEKGLDAQRKQAKRRKKQEEEAERRGRRREKRHIRFARDEHLALEARERGQNGTTDPGRQTKWGDLSCLFSLSLSSLSLFSLVSFLSSLFSRLFSLVSFLSSLLSLLSPLSPLSCRSSLLSPLVSFSRFIRAFSRGPNLDHDVFRGQGASVGQQTLAKAWRKRPFIYVGRRERREGEGRERWKDLRSSLYHQKAKYQNKALCAHTYRIYNGKK